MKKLVAVCLVVLVVTFLGSCKKKEDSFERSIQKSEGNTGTNSAKETTEFLQNQTQEGNSSSTEQGEEKERQTREIAQRFEFLGPYRASWVDPTSPWFEKGWLQFYRINNKSIIHPVHFGFRIKNTSNDRLKDHGLKLQITAEPRAWFKRAELKFGKMGDLGLTVETSIQDGLNKKVPVPVIFYPGGFCDVDVTIYWVEGDECKNVLDDSTSTFKIQVFLDDGTEIYTREKSVKIYIEDR